MTEIDIAGLRALADTVERYEDGQAIHTSGDETCVDDCAACQYEGAAGRVLPAVLDRLERYEAAWDEVTDLFPGASSEIGQDGGWVWLEEWTGFEEVFQKHNAVLNPGEGQ